MASTRPNFDEVGETAELYLVGQRCAEAVVNGASACVRVCICLLHCSPRPLRGSGGVSTVVGGGEGLRRRSLLPYAGSRAPSFCVWGRGWWRTGDGTVRCDPFNPDGLLERDVLKLPIAFSDFKEGSAPLHTATTAA